MSRATRSFSGPDGTAWGVSVRNPGASNAMVVFRHPDAATSGLDRYAWYITRGPEARSVTSRLDVDAVLAAIDDRELARLFRRSLPVSTARQGYHSNLATGQTA